MSKASRQAKMLTAEYDESEGPLHQFHDTLMATVWWDGVAAGEVAYTTNCKAEGAWSCDPPKTGAGWYAPRNAFMVFSNRRLRVAGWGKDKYTYLRIYVRSNGTTWAEASCNCPNY